MQTAQEFMEIKPDPLPEGSVSTSLLSHLLAGTYQDQQPFYHQIEMFKRQRVTLSSATDREHPGATRKEYHWIIRAPEITKVLPKSPIGQVIAYVYNIYSRLVRYVIDGRYPIDNNGAENGVRPLVLGRKNYFFCGNHQATGRTAIIYSLLGICKINHVNPVEWLADVLNRMNDCKMSNLARLLPRQWGITDRV
jgi:hypothetical protein